MKPTYSWHLNKQSCYFSLLTVFSHHYFRSYFNFFVIFSLTSGSGVKKLMKEYDSGRAKLVVQRSRSTHELVVEGKEDTRERNNFGINLNSNANNISTPTRKSG